jgi:hypothetical protein
LLGEAVGRCRDALKRVDRHRESRPTSERSSIFDLLFDGTLEVEVEADLGSGRRNQT